MHEASVAQYVLEAISKISEERQVRPKSALVSCGQLNALNNEAFALAFKAIAQGTLCEGLHLEIKHIPFRARCQACEQEFDIGTHTSACVHCGQDDFMLLPDAPLLLETIEFEED